MASLSTEGRPFAVVTGSSTGIGFELARQFATNGFDVLITSDSAAEIESAAGRLRGEDGEVLTAVADLSTFDGVDSLVEAIRATGRPVEAVALNAGIGVVGDFVRATSLEDELKCIAVNINAVVHLSKHILQHMVSRNRGKVLITASVDSISAAPFEAVYGATKAFLLMFAESIREELKDTDVSVTAIMPGVTATEFFDRADVDNKASDQVHEGKADDPADVAERAFKALMQEKDKAYVGSFKWRVMGLMSEYSPKALSALTHRPISEPHDQKEVEQRPVEDPLAANSRAELH